MPTRILPAKILARSQKRALWSVFHPQRVLAAMLAVRFFRNPLALLKCYISRTCPKDLLVEMRAGYRVHLTGDADDVVTLLVIMGRKDYGAIPRGGKIVDVGAHLGAFTLEALASGAGHVYSFEPDPVFHAALLRNTEENHLQGRVTVCRAAVVGSGGGEVVFQPSANASGHVVEGGAGSSGIRVAAITLDDIVSRHGLECIDLLKLDCEGSEYGIVFETPDPVWSRVRRIRLEYHRGQENGLRRRFESLGFTQTRATRNTKDAGLLWFDRH
jgi:FkbM family methyltransferase